MISLEKMTQVRNALISYLTADGEAEVFAAKVHLLTVLSIKETTQSIIETLQAEVQCRRCKQCTWVPWAIRHDGRFPSATRHADARCARCSTGMNLTEFTGRTRNGFRTLMVEATDGKLCVTKERVVT
jgi:hypothetical protein